jgi:hypothetical protein
MKTAVEWFAKQVLRSRQLGFISNEKFNELLYQAKEMEKEQIMNAFIFSKDPFGLSIGNSHTIKKAEDYYNTTFKSE